MKITKKMLRMYSTNSAEYVVLHAIWQKSRNHNPSLSFLYLTNPLTALQLAKRLAYFPVGSSYLEEADLSTYVCSNCGILGVKLWREYNTVLEYQSLLCAKCAGEEQEKDVSSIDESGRILSDITHSKIDQIGWRVPAVPTEDMETYWGYTSVPQPGVNWWKKLPYTHTLLGKPFLRSKIDYAKEYQKHLAGPDADIPFNPKSGIDECTCSICFYRDGENKNNPRRDCQIDSSKAKKYFGFSKETFLPTKIQNKDVGHYCPYWLNHCAE